jgi:hypothetical protein
MASWAACALALPLVALVLSGCDTPPPSNESSCGPKPTATPKGGLATEDEYRYFFCSAGGLSWGSNKAKAIAKRELANLQAANITISALTDLKVACNDLTRTSKVSWKLPDTFLRLAYQHVDPKPTNPEYSMSELYNSLVAGGDVSASMAQNLTVQLVLRHASARQLDAARTAMKSKVKLDKKAALDAAVSLAKAGADVSQCKAGDTFKKCSKAAVNANLLGTPKRYAKDGALYAAWEFVTYYGEDSWLVEWNAAPEEKRFLPNDKVAYTAPEFYDFFGVNSWATKWNSATVATQQRIAKNGAIYTMPEFVTYYKDGWQSEWQEAPEVMCQECRPFDADTVSGPALSQAVDLLV